MPTVALITSGGSALGAFELDGDEAQDGAVIRRPGEPDRRVVGVLDVSEEEASLPAYDVLIVERV